jgi:hypothetical protein
MRPTPGSGPELADRVDHETGVHRYGPPRRRRSFQAVREFAEGTHTQEDEHHRLQRLVIEGHAA